MSIFLSRYTNNIDRKNRVSIPASYRNIILQQSSFHGVIAYPSFKNNCIEFCSIKHLEQISSMINNFEPYSEQRDAFETIILGEAVQLIFDSEGRVVLPKNLIEHANVKEQVYFIGKGVTFEMWEINNFTQYLAKAREIVKANKWSLKDRQGI